MQNLLTMYVFIGYLYVNLCGICYQRILINYSIQNLFFKIFFGDNIGIYILTDCELKETSNDPVIGFDAFVTCVVDMDTVVYKKNPEFRIWKRFKSTTHDIIFFIYQIEQNTICMMI